MSIHPALAPHYAHLTHAEQLISGTKLQEALGKVSSYVTQLKDLDLAQENVDQNVQLFAEAIKADIAAEGIFSMVRSSLEASRIVTGKPSFSADDRSLVEYWEDCTATYGEEEMNQTKEPLDQKREEVRRLMKGSRQPLRDLREELNKTRPLLITAVYFAKKPTPTGCLDKIRRLFTSHTWYFEQALKSHGVFFAPQGG